MLRADSHAVARLAQPCAADAHDWGHDVVLGATELLPGNKVVIALRDEHGEIRGTTIVCLRCGYTDYELEQAKHG